MTRLLFAGCALLALGACTVTTPSVTIGNPAPVVAPAPAPAVIVAQPAPSVVVH